MLINKPLILSTGTGVAPAHTIDQSIRFNDDDSAYMSKTFASAGNRKTWSLSFWWKRGNLSSVANKRQILFRGGTFSFYSNHNSSTIDGINFSYTATANDLQTTQVFRDPSAWYHIVVNMDTSNPITPERVRLYVNGSRVTSFASSSYPSLNTEYQFNSNVEHNIGRRSAGEELDGYLAEIVFIDGQALDPSSFGLYNDSNIWIPKDVGGLTFGTKGFHIKGETASDLGNDSSSNNNDFTTSGLASHDQMVGESPTNNFAVFNPVMTNDADFEFSEGNLKLDMNTNKSWYVGAGASMSMTSGKWYWESYWNSGDSYTIWGILDTEQLHALAGSSGSTTIYDQNFNGIQPNTSGTNDQYRQGASVIATGQGGSPGGIWMFALDMDNKKMWLGYNGTWIGSGDPAGGTNETWSSTYIASSSYTPINAGYQISQHSILTYNFGQDSTFAGNVTAGGNSDGNGIGNFKYSVPSGFLALCTKNLGS